MPKLSSKEFLKSLGQLAGDLRRQIEASVDGFAADPVASSERRQQACQKSRSGFEFFCRTYFPHYIKSPNSLLHDYLYMRLAAIIASPKSETDALAAPRGEAKSTITSQLFVLWCVLHGFKRYPIIVMDAVDQAALMLEAIKAELEFNPRLLMDYPEACGVGRVWQVGSIITNNDAKIEVFGSGKKIRGRRHGPHRPDLAIGDDLENDENVRSPDQRDKLQAWLTKGVMKLGGAGEKFDVVIIGTVLHYDSLLNRLLNNELWHSRRFKAVMTWPPAMDLWADWESLLRNDGEAAADAYYVQNADEMNRGAVVSWPSTRPLVALMKIRARDGHAAFDSEYQNDPLSGDDAPFAEALKDCYYGALPPNLVYFGAVDPSLGKHGASRDPSAILVGGLDRTTGKLYVLEAGIKKRLPDKIIEDVITLQKQYRCVLWVVESVQFQEFLRTELVKRSAIAGAPVPARAVTPHTDKLLRIESLQPHIQNGLILLNPEQRVLIEQLRHFPKADHDDGPDALHMLWAAAISGCAPIAFTPVAPSANYGGGGAW